MGSLANIYDLAEPRNLVPANYRNIRQGFANDEIDGYVTVYSAGRDDVGRPPHDVGISSDADYAIHPMWRQGRRGIIGSSPAGGRRRTGTGDQGTVSPAAERRTEMGFRVILTTGLATLYLAGVCAALSLLLSMWSPTL